MTPERGTPVLVVDRGGRIEHAVVLRSSARWIVVRLDVDDTNVTTVRALADEGVTWCRDDGGEFAKAFQVVQALT